MNTVEIYDPALCCSTGVCGPSPDTELTSFAATLQSLKSAGVSVNRYNLAQEPLAFAQNTCVKTKLESDGESALPLTFLNGKLHFRGVYPTQSQLEQLLDLKLNDSEPCCSSTAEEAPKTFVKAAAPTVSPAKDSCCDPSTGCC